MRHRRGPAPARSTLATLAVAVVVLLGTVLVPTGAGAATTISVTPDTGLVDGQLVTVVGTGFDPRQRLEIFQCRAAPVDEFDCDLNVAFEFDADDAGVATFELQVDASIYLGPGNVEGPWDCRSAPGACLIGLGYALDADEAALAPIAFDPTAPLRPPVSMTVTPTAGLVDGQVLTVTGANLTNREESFVYQCRAGAPVSGNDCDFHFDGVRGVAAADGTITLEWPAKTTLFPPLGGTIDCTTGPGACEIVLSWSFIGPPDRIARTAITFGTGEPPPTSEPEPGPESVEPAATTPRFTG